MTDAAVAETSAEQDSVLAAVDDQVESIRRSLDKEGAGLEVEVDAENSKLIVTLVRHRIVCEGCLLPEHLVQTMLNQTLKKNNLSYTLETRNWLLDQED
jgi:hypothetical protein